MTDLSWDTTTDWDSAQSESDVYHPAGDLSLAVSYEYADNFESYTTGSFPSANWTQGKGTHQISTDPDGDKAVDHVSGTGAAMLHNASNTVSVSSGKRYIQANVIDVTSGDNDPHPGVVLSWTDSNNYDAVYIRLNSGEIVWWKFRSGGSTATILATQSITASVYHELRVEVSSTDTVEVYFDGSLIDSGTITPVSSSGAGLWTHSSQGSGNGYLDDFQFWTDELLDGSMTTGKKTT